MVHDSVIMSPYSSRFVLEVQIGQLANVFIGNTRSGGKDASQSKVDPFPRPMLPNNFNTSAAVASGCSIG